jgi:hypothetical protein
VATVHRGPQPSRQFTVLWTQHADLSFEKQFLIMLNPTKFAPKPSASGTILI